MEVHGFTNEALEDLQWSSLGYALRRQTQPDRDRLIKFINGWLPVNDFLVKQNQSQTSECPVCKHPQEDTDHLIACTHKMREEEWAKCITGLEKQCRDSKTNDSLCSFLIAAVKASRFGKEPEFDQQNSTLVRLAAAQKAIGWKQLIFGRWSQQWGLAYVDLWKEAQKKSSNTHNIFPPVSAEEWISSNIVIIWHTFQAIWTQRNEAKHGSKSDSTSRDQLKRERLTAEVNSLYYQRHLISTEAQCIFPENKTAFLNKPNQELALPGYSPRSLFQSF